MDRGRGIGMKCQADLIGLPFAVLAQLCCYCSFSPWFGSAGCVVELFVTFIPQFVSQEPDEVTSFFYVNLFLKILLSAVIFLFA